MTRRKKPGLSKEDEALWQAFTKSMKPLDRAARRVSGPSVRPPLTDTGLSRRSAAGYAKPPALPGPMPSPAPHQATPSRPGERQPEPAIDRRRARKLRKGHMPIDRKVDLHGMTQDQAHDILVRAITQTYHQGGRCVLVVTGKGGKRWRQTGGELPVAMRTFGDFETGSGVLKRVVPMWLGAADLGPMVQSFGRAADVHGGDGALYVMLKRPR